MITIPFEIIQGDQTFRDAIVLPDDHTLSQTEIDLMKQNRFDDWVKIITMSVEEPTVEE